MKFSVANFVRKLLHFTFEKSKVNHVLDAAVMVLCVKQKKHGMTIRAHGNCSLSLSPSVPIAFIQLMHFIDTIVQYK